MIRLEVQTNIIPQIQAHISMLNPNILLPIPIHIFLHPHRSILHPHLLSETPVPEIRLHHPLLRLRRHPDGQPLVVPAAEPLEFVEPGQGPTRNRVELASDPVARPGLVDEEGDAEGPANQGEGLNGTEGAEEYCVV